MDVGGVKGWTGHLCGEAAVFFHRGGGPPGEGCMGPGQTDSGQQATPCQC